MSADGPFPVQLLDAAVDLMGRAGRGGTVRVRGGSMRPMLRPGHVLAVEFSTGKLRAGELLLFRQQDYLVVHRLLGRVRLPDGRPCLRTRGDGVGVLDPPLEATRVVGRVIAVYRGGGWRDLKRRGARFYARALALHDLAWAAFAAVAGRADRILGRLRDGYSLRSLVGRMDRWLLNRLDALFFRLIHPRAHAPEEAGVEQEPASSGARMENEKAHR